jgi:hypothetical protein
MRRDTFTFIGGGKLVLKWDLRNGVAMVGKPTRKILALIAQLQEEGRL